MPAVEPPLIRAPAAHGSHFDTGTGGSTGQSPAAGADDFASFMDAKLASPSRKAAEKNAALADPNQSPDKSSADAAPTSAAAPPATGAGKESPAKSKSTTDPNDLGTVNAQATSAQTPAADPLPVFLSLPLYLSLVLPADPKIPDAAPKAATTDADQTADAPASALVEAGKPAASAPTSSTPAAPLDLTALKPTEKVETAPAATSKEASQSEELMEATPNMSPSTIPNPARPQTDPAADAKNVLTWESAAENAGTGVASTVWQMNNPQNTNKVAQSDVKVLPVGGGSDTWEKNLPSQLTATPTQAGENHGSDLNSSFTGGNNQSSLADSSPVLNVVDLPSLADARMRTLDRTQDMVALHSMRLVESNSDSMSVVIKPAVGTELSLELRQHDGGVEAHATLTRGDHQLLSEHWSELQQRLEQRGIKLAPLATEMDTAGGQSQQQFHQSSEAALEEAAQQASAFAEFATAGNLGGATARLAVIHDGWESWA